jgi:hypothetical protein
MTAALVAAFLLAQSLLAILVTAAFLALTPEQLTPAELFGGLGLNALLPTLLRIVFFAAGVFLSLAFVAPVRAADGWRRTIVLGVVATLLGVAAVFVLGLVQAFVSAGNPGTFPFGYSFGPSIDAASIPEGIGRALDSALDPLIDWIVPVVLAAVLLKVWLGRHPAEVTAPASAAAKP